MPCLGQNSENDFVEKKIFFLFVCTMIFRWALLLAGVKWRAGLSQIGLEHDINHQITLIASDMINIDMNTIALIIPNLLILWICRLRYVELNIVPNISCVANLGLVDIQVNLLGCQVVHHVHIFS